MQNPEFVHATFSAIASRYVTANHVLSMGIDIAWRQRVVQLVAEWHPARLLDIATGTGDLALALTRALPEIDILGTDFCQPMLDVAAARGLRNLLQADAMNLPLPDASFDAATVAFGLRNMADYAAAIREFRRILKPGGHLLILDFSLPEGILSTPYRYYLHHILPRIAGRITRRPDAYTYLGDSIEQFPRGKAMCRLIEANGFTETRAEQLSGGIAAIYTATCADEPQPGSPA